MKVLKVLKLLTFITLSHNVFAVNPPYAIDVLEYPSPRWDQLPIHSVTAKINGFTMEQVPDGNGGYKFTYTLNYYTPNPTGHPSGTFGDTTSGNATIQEVTDTTFRQWRAFIFSYLHNGNEFGVHRVRYVTTDSDWIFKDGFD